LSNAVKFTEKGTVRLLARFEDGSLHVAVSDTGIGIPPERFAGLFLPFQQEGSAKYRNQGTGLGLAISQNLVEQMGGRLWVESRPGEGSCFTFEAPLPVLPNPGGVLPMIGPPPVRSYRRRDGNAAPFALLVVDDQADNRALLRDLLSPLGFVVVEADGGEAGVAMARERRPDLVLMDLAMPDLNGLEATARILETPGLGRLPIVACSASAFEEDRRRSFEACCADHLAKPVQVGELFDCIGRHLALEWVRDAPPKTSMGPPAASADGPDRIPPALRERLLELVRRGKIVAVRKLIAETDAEGDALFDELRAAADRMDLRRARHLLER
jgi:CheY-like chemotaxis protein